MVRNLVARARVTFKEQKSFKLSLDLKPPVLAGYSEPLRGGNASYAT
jgi:hypothetical protein